MVDCGSVAVSDVQEDLDAVVLFVQEVNLVLKLLQIGLVDIMLVLLSQLVHVLATLVQLAEPQYFIVSDLDGAALALQFLLKG